MGQLEALHHVLLSMPNGGERKARAFYGGLLGIPEVRKPGHLEARGGAWFERNDIRIHLGVEDPFHPARKAHPALLVRGLAKLIARLRDAGSTVMAADESLDGTDRVYVNDPFGNRIELMQLA